MQQGKRKGGCCHPEAAVSLIRRRQPQLRSDELDFLGFGRSRRLHADRLGAMPGGERVQEAGGHGARV